MKISIGKTNHFSTQILFCIKGQSPQIPDFEANKNEITVRYTNDTTHIYCGCGDRGTLNADTIRSAAANSIRKAFDLKKNKVSIQLVDIEHQIKSDSKCLISALIEGLFLGKYSFSKYKTDAATCIEALEFVTTTVTLKQIKEIETLCDCVDFARDLVNENADLVTPDYLASISKSLVKLSAGTQCTILTEKEIKNQKLGLLEAVGRGSPYPPRLIIVDYKGNPKTKEKTALIGKGITFDSGGYNLKPSGSIETMACDMAGAATVLATLKATLLLKLKINCVFVIAAAHNAVNGTSYFPGSVYTSYSGKTVEINNTDAEGRLILADAISYCIKKYAPTELIDLATLTGSIINSFGDLMAGLFSMDDSLAQTVINASMACGEKVWRMPLDEYYRESLKSDRADLRNLSKLPRGHAGAITGAAFLSHFTESLPWVHLDIAGTSYNDREPRGEIPKYGTGYGVRLLFQFLSVK